MSSVESMAGGGVADSGHKKVGEETLAPQRERIMDPWSYLFAWLGGCVSIGTFTVGSGLVGTLNLIQTVVAIAIGCTVIGLALMINGLGGTPISELSVPCPPSSGSASRAGSGRAR